MSERAALEHVFDLARAPGLARKLRERPLPGGMLQVLRLAAGDEQSLHEVVSQTGRSAAALRDAAQFYIVQVLLNPSADSYRILGATSAATRDELRTHMVWLLKCLHPDATRGGPQAVFASRVTAAWESLKSVERREQYDVGRARPNARKPGLNSGSRPYVAAKPRPHPRPSSNRTVDSRKVRSNGRKRMVAVAGIVCAGVATAAVFAWGGGGFLERANTAMFDLLRPTFNPQALADRRTEDR